MDPSVCRLHPGVAVTGFCPACLRDRLAGLQPPSSADLRRCKSFSYARSAAAVEPQRRSCDLFRHQQPNHPMAAAAAVAVPEDYQQHQYQYQYPYQEAAAARPQEQGAYSSSRNNKSGFGLHLLGRKLQQWRRKSKKPEPEEMQMPVGRQQHSCDADEGPVLARIPATVLSSLSVEEEDDGMMKMRSDGQIPVEEDYYDYDYDDISSDAPGGTAQTRDYYLDSSSSSRRRRSVDGRNSFSISSDAINGGNINARVSPAERPLYHHHHHYHEAQSVLVHHHQYSQQYPSNKNKKQGIRGWSIWGLLHKKKKQPSHVDVAVADHDLVLQQQHQQQAAASGDQYYPYPWPELRARGYNGQMLRCNSTISARSSFSGGAAMIGGSGRRSIDMRDVAVGERRTRRDELLLERTRSSLSSYSRSSGGHGPADPATASRPPNIPRRSASSRHHDLSSSMHRRSTLGL